ncbi:MerR family transcriptional regulator [Tengunoibacter tsumagoiensis]|uniref:MerR family transcriptional regulator n=1 Tax=Tengunoibacter tsumagoiensis TaxID=2014871 RepID=A0A401ZY75_9CHLR|nr:MerR family transcriptional regulator [Tengunoibacter tsumagoiensis]GCE11782.1 MerR family transcriptional regulator [Tengunoibacter tsumagoiensis]
MPTTDQDPPTTPEPVLYYTIEQVANRTGLTKRTLRYYEEMELLLPTDRTEGNYRRYTEAEIIRIERIKALRDLLGFTLTEIREILEADDERNQIKAAFQQETNAQAKIAQLDRADELIQKQIALIEQKISGLTQMQTELQARLEKHQRRKEELNNTPL